MYGDLLQIRDNVIFVEGQEPRTVLLDLDMPSVLVYRSDEDLYIHDTGATPFFREKIHQAVEKLRPFSRLFMLNSHSHVDHTANNSIIHDIECDEKFHLLSQAGIEGLDHERSMVKSFEEISKYYFFLEGPRFPYSLVTRPLGLTRYINKRAPYFFVKKTIQGFAPLEPSSETVRPFEENELLSLELGPMSWPGWKISDKVWALETRGHSPDSISFFLPEENILFLGDETLMYFNCWLDSSAANVRAALEMAMKLLDAGVVETVIGSHQQKPYDGREAKELVDKLTDGYDRLEQEIYTATDSFPEGATVAQIYRQLKKRKAQVPEVISFLEYEFPKMPIFMKTLITGLLLEKGYEAVGREGKMRFLKR